MFTRHDRPSVYQARPVAQSLQTDICLEEKIMERLHMNHLRDLIHRLRAGESERRIARDLKISRPTVHKYHVLAKREGYLEAGSALPDDATLRAVLGPGPQPPKITSSLGESILPNF